MDRLDQILATKQKEVEVLLPRLEEFRRAALDRNEFRGFRASLANAEDELGIIAEVKRASPSAGLIATDFNPLATGRAYEQGGANAISVLTDGPWFQGSLADMQLVRSGTGIPVLRKDFTIHEVQIYEAVAAGADAILLIVAALTQEKLLALLDVALLCQVDVIVEVHSAEELDRALDTPANLVGINNRNLKTFEIDLSVTERLAPSVEDDVLLLSESGIRELDDIRRLRNAAVDGILVGESLMRHGDPARRLAEFRQAWEGAIPPGH